MNISRSAVALAAGLSLISSAVRSEPDVLMRAVGFALTGSDNADPKSIDRTNCVFAIDNDVFRLNNVQTDRLRIRAWKRASNFGDEHWVTVELHGDSVVYEHTTEPKDGDSTASPDMFESQRTAYKEHQLTLRTADQDRVTRAWQYIYSNGCVGKKSPF